MLVERNLLVPLADGVTLAGDLYRPGSDPAPVLISFYPYRKDDIIGSFTERQRLALVERGYAHLLVDVRGFGGSDGSSVESQDPRAEGRDAAEVVEWVARQAWCDGAVGVWGVSYGGLAALAVAAERPPALRAIASIYGLQDVAGNFVAPGDVRSALGLVPPRGGDARAGAHAALVPGSAGTLARALGAAARAPPLGRAVGAALARAPARRRSRTGRRAPSSSSGSTSPPS